jgi:hypothetical protein
MFRTKEEIERAKRNRDIIRRKQQGDPLQGVSSETWFPPRPLIKKDEEAVKKLYGEPSAPAEKHSSVVRGRFRLLTALDDDSGFEDNK